jgi:hypothetical protein
MNAYLHQAILVYPSKMLYPDVLPLVSMLDALHNKSSTSQFEYNQKRLKLCYIAFMGYVPHNLAGSYPLVS